MHNNAIGRIVSIDYGMCRTGLATTDPTQRIATRLCTLPTEKVLSFLQTYAQQTDIKAFVIGEPKDLTGEETNATLPARHFATALSHAFPKLPLHWIDERFTSQEARRTLFAAGLPKGKRRQKGIDRWCGCCTYPSKLP